MALIVFLSFAPRPGWTELRDASATERRLVHLELVLAVDSSSSVTDDEFVLQMEGIAGAFEDAAVLQAIAETAPDGIAVSLLQWSSAGAYAVALDWRHVASAEDALAYARQVRRSGRLVGGGATSISTALTQAMVMLEGNAYHGKRRVIDVSGDGRANEGDSPALTRALANQAGITINGLAILNEEPDLASYYQAWVVGGPGSFLLTADDFADFAVSMKRKLYFEIVGPAIAHSPADDFDGARPDATAQADTQRLR
ncbi:DUF1194 domain-containing protein [Pelagibius sp.]|uniref:DUF1194 domain-containing protein n=1 Tax=Pelagibius sp. TaxID=1931238 RepID=UPI003B50932A